MKEAIQIPRHLFARPMWRGLPIPFIALIKSDGTPDFRVTDEASRMFVIKHRRCQLCAKPLGKWMFFVGGTKAAESNAYFEPAAHLDCTLYAMQVCPFIIGKMEHVGLEKVQKQYAGTKVQVSFVDNVLAPRNPFWVIKKATGYDVVSNHNGTVLLHPHVVAETHALCPEKMSAEDWHDVRGMLM